MTKQQASFGSEVERLSALSSYNVLDTLPEKEYDAITRLASYICQVPIALISLIDAERQWFKSKIGLDAIETPRADAFCNYTILDNEILEVTDALANDTFKNNVLVTGSPDIRFYAGAPLIDPEGHRLGSLCVIDRVPRKLTPEQRDALRTLADEVMSHLVLSKQKKELEASLAVHKDFYRLFNSSSEVHFIADRESNIELINDAVLPVLGYTPEQATGRSLWEFVVGKDRDQFLPLIEKAITTKKAFELETQTVTASGEVKWIGWCAITKEGKWYASGRDITYQKTILADLEQLSLVASKMINGVAISDANDKVVWTNDAFVDMTGFQLADVEHKRLRDVIAARTAEAPDNEEYNRLISSKKSYQIDVPVNRKDGQMIWVSLITSVIYDSTGEVEKYIRVLVDITARKSTEKDLEILSFAARKTPTGMLIRNREGIIIWMNEAMERIVGYSLAEMKGKIFGTMLNGEDTDLSVLEQALNAVKENRAYEVELKIYKKDGTPIWASIANSPLFNESGTVERQIGVFVDISARKKSRGAAQNALPGSQQYHQRRGNKR